MNTLKQQGRSLPDFIRPDASEAFANENKKKVIVSEDFDHYGIIPEGKRIGALKVHLGRGNIATMFYRHLVSPIFFNGYKLVLYYGGNKTIEITGDNLEPILDYVIENRLVWIKRAEDQEKQPPANENKTWIETVLYKNPKPS